MTGTAPSAIDHQSRAFAATPHASKYLQQLCKHFAHKVETRFSDTEGKVLFSIGRCDLQARPDGLSMRISAPTAEDLATLKDVVASHLLRFAFRETLTVDWDLGDSAGPCSP